MRNLKTLLKEMKNMIKAVIFDADGTLYNVKTERAYSLSADFLFKKTGISAEIIRVELKKTIDKIRFSPFGLFDPEKRQRKYALEKTLLRLGIDKKNAIVLTAEALDIFWSIVIEDLEKFPIVIETIKNLAKKYDIAVTSEEFRENLIMKLNCVFGDWKKYFKVLITPEETGTMKPSEKYYLIAMHKFHLSSPEILAVGDSEERDIIPAKKLGIRALKISPNEFSKVAGMLKAE